MTTRNAAAFVSSILTLVACGGGATSQPAPTSDRMTCEVSFVTPPGFERTDTFEEPYPDRVGVRLGFRDETGRELHAFAGIPGEFGEGLPDAGTVRLATGGTGRLSGGVHEVWVLSWEEGGVCDPRVVLGNGFDRGGFLELLPSPACERLRFAPDLELIASGLPRQEGGGGMKRSLLALVLTLVVVAAPAHAKLVDLTASPNPRTSATRSATR